MKTTTGSNTEPTAPSATNHTATMRIRYVGPAGQTSPVFGELVPNEQYSADADFATYLVDTHPDYWQRA